MLNEGPPSTEQATKSITPLYYDLLALRCLLSIVYKQWTICCPFFLFLNAWWLFWVSPSPWMTLLWVISPGCVSRMQVLFLCYRFCFIAFCYFSLAILQILIYCCGFALSLLYLSARFAACFASLMKLLFGVRTWGNLVNFLLLLPHHALSCSFAQGSLSVSLLLLLFV